MVLLCIDYEPLLRACYGNLLLVGRTRNLWFSDERISSSPKKKKLLRLRMGGAIYFPLTLHDMYRDGLTLCGVLIPINNAAFQCSPVSYAVRRFGNSFWTT